MVLNIGKTWFDLYFKTIFISGAEENPETNPHKYSQLTFDKSPKVINGEKIIFSVNGARTTGYLHANK